MSGFVVYPAIDLRAGRVVRLRLGDPSQQTVFGEDPAETARGWVAQGAEWLHVVNLDGALGESGAAANLSRLKEICAAVSVPVQFGGGLRRPADIEAALALGASRAILGTVAVREPAIVAGAVEAFGADVVVVAVDARDGWVATHGWAEKSALRVEDLAAKMRDCGVFRLLFTDIGRDGTLEGVNLAATAALARSSGLRIIASGGVGTLGDVRALARISEAGVEGVIVGQALYTGTLSLPEILETVRESMC